MNPTPSSTSAFPYTNPYTNPYTQRRTTKPASSSSSLSPYTNAAQQQWEQSLEILVRSTVVPPAQTVERLYGSLQKAQEQSTPDDQFCWNLEMARSFVTYCIRMFGCHENINMTGRNPEGYPCILSFLARALEDWSFDDSIMYQVIVEEFQVELEEHRGSRTSSQQNKTLTMSLLQLLHNLAVNFHDPIIRDPAVAGLSITWRYLDRIYFLTSWRNHHSSLTTSIDAAWWMPVTNELSLANMALQELLKEERRDFPKVYMFPTSIEMRISWTSVLFCFLKHDRVGWLHKLGSQTKKVLNDLSRELLDQAGKLSDSNNQMQHNIHLALASVSLLLLMDSKEKLDISNEFNQYVYSTKLIESAFRSYFHMFGASSPSGSRWTYEHKDKITQRWAEECIYAWSLSKEEVTCKMAFDAIENHWRQPVEDLFLSLVSDSPDKHINDIQSQTGRQINHHKRNKELFSRLLLLYSVHHESVRSILGRILSRTSTCDNRSVDFLAQPCHKLVQSLIFYSTQGSNMSLSIYAASFLRSLLSDRTSPTTHDEISRSIWKAITPEFTNTFLRKVVEQAKTDVAVHQRPLLLCMLDTIDLAFSSDMVLQEVLQTIDTESLEVLIHLMWPKDIRIDQAGVFMDTSQDTTFGDDNTDTPPVNNLSHFDEASICVENEQEEKPVGLDYSIRLSVAVILSRIGYFDLSSTATDASNSRTSNSSGLRLIQSRIRSAVIEFFSTAVNYPHSEQQSSSPSSGWNYLASSSMELTRRRFRLLNAMAVPENEEFLSSCLFSKEKEHENIVDTLRAEIENGNKRLEAVAEKEKRLEKEKSTLQGAIDSQSVRFWREINRVKKSAQEQTNSKISIFDAERKMAEHRAHELSKRLTEAENRVAEADQCARDSHEAETKVRQDHDEIQKKLQEREEENEELRRDLGLREAKISEIQNALGSAEDRLVSMNTDNDDLRQLIGDKEADIAELKEARETMERNLDCLFGDLVKLCHIYEAKEKSEAELQSQNESLSSQLRESRSKKEVSEQKLFREKEELQLEKEKLERKLVKYKEKLEAERRERKGVETKTKSYKPVAYLNHLHDSANSSMNNTRSYHEKSQKKSSSSSRSHKPRSKDKENDYDSSYRGTKKADKLYVSSQRSCLRMPYK